VSVVKIMVDVDLLEQLLDQAAPFDPRFGPAGTIEGLQFEIARARAAK